jgi:AcrR family transcriptional regulator
VTPIPAITAEIREHQHGRVPRALRERQILALAEELFAEQGYAGASMDELARRAGVSKPVIYDIAGSKEQLYRRCVSRQSEELAGRIAAAAAAEPDAAGQLHAGILAFFRFVEEHRRVWQALAADVSPFAEEAAHVRQRQTALVVALIAGSAERFGAHLDPHRVEATAYLLNGAIEGLARWWGDRTDLSPEMLADWAVALVLPGIESLVASSQTAPAKEVADA